MIAPTRFGRRTLRGDFTVPGDKSISHRALIVGAARRAELQIENLNDGNDVAASADALRLLGADITLSGSNASVYSRGLHSPSSHIDCRNSGSTARMLMGVCAGAGLQATLVGDASLTQRPMEPVAAQLRAFGARIRSDEGHLPVEVHAGREVETRRFILVSPSAQVKSALLFAALYRGVGVRIAGDRGSRDHTERLLRGQGGTIAFDAAHVVFEGHIGAPQPLRVPGDFSSAAFLIVAAVISTGSDVRIADVGVNGTRTGLLDALHAMGACVALRNERMWGEEPVADLVVGSSPLRATTIGADVGLRAIDELPVLAVAAAFAEGETRILGVRELRTKESDRVAAIVRMLDAVGITSEILPNGIAIRGGTPRANGSIVATHGDHRTAMSVAALACGAGDLAVDDIACIDVSFPGFLSQLGRP